MTNLEQIESVSSSGPAGARGTDILGNERGPAHSLTRGNSGNLLQHFTGSGRHNAALREGAVRRGLHVSEYGVLNDADGNLAQVRERAGGI